MPKETKPAPTTSEDSKTLTEVLQHYAMASKDNDARRPDWDKKIKLFRSHIDEDDWPFQSMVFDPRIFTLITEKTARIIATKPRGRVLPREGGDVQSARMINELHSFQWDNARHKGEMLEKWAIMDQRARIFGASFGICKWWYESRPTRGKDKKLKKKVFDSPEFLPINPYDALPDPNATSIEDCRWFGVRSYPTLQELERINDAARSEPTYSPAGLKMIKEAIKSKRSASKETDYTNIHRKLSKVEDQSAADPTNRIIKIVTEYRPDRWITFAPDFKVVLRDIPNPCDHYEIPITMLRYLPTGDDIYGLSEIEPMEKLQRAINSIINQYLDNAILELYPPLIVNPSGVENYLALEWAPGEPWAAADPSRDIKRLESSAGQTTMVFTNTYSFLVAALMEAAGETSTGVSNLRPFQPGKTATEVQALAIERNVRDNYNIVYLTQAMARQARLWFLLNRQFIKSPEVIRVVGRDTLAAFKKEPLKSFQDVVVPMGGEKVPKLRMEDELAFLVIEPHDLDGDYDFIFDQESFVLPKEQERREAQRLTIELLVNNPNVQALLEQEGFTPKIKELLVELLQGNGLKDADRFFNAVGPQMAPPPGMPTAAPPGMPSPIPVAGGAGVS